MQQSTTVSNYPLRLSLLNYFIIMHLKNSAKAFMALTNLIIATGLSKTFSHFKLDVRFQSFVKTKSK